MAYIVRWTSQEGGRTELAFTRKEDALVSASSAVDRGEKEVEVLNDGKPLPHSAFAPKHRKRKKAS
jgi:hypothetical protein